MIIITGRVRISLNTLISSIESATSFHGWGNARVVDIKHDIGDEQIITIYLDNGEKISIKASPFDKKEVSYGNRE